MNINLDANRSRLSAYKPAAAAQPERNPLPAGRTHMQTDQVVISSEGQQAVLQDADATTKLENALQNGDSAVIAEAAKEKASTLEVNRNASIDPDGKIYAAAYVESIVRQYEKARETIESYYAEAHQENLSFDSPSNHIILKYKDGLFPNSPYFRSDLSAEEREMAFEQERALLLGGRLTMNDPYALKSSGGVLNIRDVDRIAHQAAQDKLDALWNARENSRNENAAAP